MSDPLPPPSSSTAAASGPASAAGTTRSKWVNPYAGHRALSESEADVLGEYARLAETIKRVTLLSAPLSASATHGALLTQLRVLERKMGLVLTLFKASVWALVVEQQDLAEEAERRREEQEAQWREQDSQMGDETARY